MWCLADVSSVSPLLEQTKTFLVELLEWGCTFSGFWDKKVLVSRDLKLGRFAVKMVPAVVLIVRSRLALNSFLKSQ